MSRMSSIRDAARGIGKAGATASAASAVGTAAVNYNTRKGTFADKFKSTLMGAAYGFVGGATGAAFARTTGSSINAYAKSMNVRAGAGPKLNPAAMKMRASALNRGSSFMSGSAFRRSVAGGAAVGFASNILSSNSAANPVNFDERFEYMKRVKKMQVDENIRQAREVRVRPV